MTIIFCYKCRIFVPSLATSNSFYMKKISFVLAFLLATLMACDKNTDSNAPKLVFQFKFDSTQVRLNNLGLPATMPTGHAAQSPKFHSMSAHYIELAPNAFTQLGAGEVVYNGPTTTQGGSEAIDFSKEIVVDENAPFFSIPLSDVAPGTYTYLRTSLAYQNYDVRFRALGFPFTGRLASFVGFNTYIKDFKIKDSTVQVNANKLQGYWAFETNYGVFKGESANTTVPNPLASTSPVPAGSCVVTGAFPQALTIIGNETTDIVITISLSTNKSFEWNDLNANQTWDPLEGEMVVDMGLRGLIPLVE